jgi:hypothetical protein
MKKILLFSACVLLVFSACKKDSAKTATSTSITATIGSSNLNFSTAAVAQVISSNGIYAIQIIGSNGTGSSAQGVSIDIQSDKPIVKGTYSVTDTSSFTDITYVENPSVSTPVSFSSSTIGTVTITSISSTNVQGTFSGTLVSNQDNTTTQTLSNGKFNVGVLTTKEQ